MQIARTREVLVLARNSRHNTSVQRAPVRDVEIARLR
jgi:hypothetical protein